MDKLYTPDEVAEILRVKVATVKRWLREGKLPGHKLGRLWRIKESDLEGFKELGGGHKYQGHAPGHIRQALIDAFEATQSDDREWWETFNRPEDAFLLLGKLWNCSDILPGDLYEEIKSWAQVDEFHGTYGAAARVLKEELSRALEEGKERRVKDE